MNVKTDHRNHALAYKALDDAYARIADRWGKDRLLRLAGEALRIKFLEAEDQLTTAIAGNDLELVAKKAASVARGIEALDKAARAAAHDPDQVDHWHVSVDGRDFVVTAKTDEWVPMKRVNPAACVISVEELLRLQVATEQGRLVFSTKDHFPGATAVYGGPVRSSTLSRVINDDIPF